MQHNDSIGNGLPAGEESLPTPSPHVVYRAVSEGGVLLHMETEIYFGLNHLGARVWELLPPVSRTLDELCPKIVQEYPDACPDVVREDVRALLHDLSTHGLVTSRPGHR